jgi:hypothetical protein
MIGRLADGTGRLINNVEASIGRSVWIEGNLLVGWPINNREANSGCRDRMNGPDGCKTVAPVSGNESRNNKKLERLKLISKEWD